MVADRPRFAQNDVLRIAIEIDVIVRCYTRDFLNARLDFGQCAHVAEMVRDFDNRKLEQRSLQAPKQPARQQMGQQTRREDKDDCAKANQRLLPGKNTPERIGPTQRDQDQSQRGDGTGDQIDKKVEQRQVRHLGAVACGAIENLAARRFNCIRFNCIRLNYIERITNRGILKRCISNGFDVSIRPQAVEFSFPSGKGAGGNGPAHAAHDLLEVVQIMPGQQHAGNHLLRAKHVVQVSP